MSRRAMRRIFNPACPINWRHPLNRGLRGAWLSPPYLAGGSQLYDLCGKNNGALTNGPSWGTGFNGFGALIFNGSNNYVTASPSVLNAVTECTVIATVSTNTLVGGGTLNLRAFVSANSNVYTPGTFSFEGRLETATDRFVLGFTNTTGGGTGPALPTHTAVTNRWYHIACTLGAGVQQGYLDGVIGTAGSMTGVTGTSSVLQIGAGRYTGASAADVRQWSGSVGAVFIYSRALTASEIVAHYAQWRLGFPDIPNWVASCHVGSAETPPVTPSSFQAARSIATNFIIGCGVR